MYKIILFLFILFIVLVGVGELILFINSGSKSLFYVGMAAYFFFMAGFNTGTLLRM